MNIWSINELTLFIAFVIPGFISLKSYQLLFPGESNTSNKLLVDAVSYSSINYAILFWPIYEIEHYNVREAHPTLYALFYLFALLIAPVIWVYLLKWIRTRQFAQQVLPHPTLRPWDFIFSKRHPYWIVVTLKNGNRVGGRYDGLSFASSAPAQEQLYLEEHWLINQDGGFERPCNETAGILILSSEIATVEFFHLQYGEINGKQEVSQ